MRQLVLGCVLLSGCLLTENPAYDREDSTGAGGSSGGETAPTTTASETSPPTTGGPEGPATETSGGSTGAPTTSLTDGDDTGDSSGAPGTTGAPAAVCNASELVELKMEDDAVADAGVASWGMPCPWKADKRCDELNFGKTEFYRLVNDGEVGGNAALIRFPAELVTEQIADSGRALEDLIGARLQVVIWEPKPGPDGPVELQVHLLHEDNFDWPEGERDGEPAQNDESSGKCRTIDKDDCHAWAGGDALAGSELLAPLYLTPEKAMATDLDDSDSEYHAKIMSEPLGMPLMLAYGAGKRPSLAVTLASPRALESGEIGIKLRESPYDNPRLFAEFCNDWAD